MKSGNRLKQLSLSKGLLYFVALYYCLLVVNAYIFCKPCNFFELLFSSEVLKPLRLSLISSSIASLLSISIAIPCAYSLSRNRSKFSIFIDTIIDIPIFLSPVALGSLLLIFFSGSSGLLLKKVGIDVAFSFLGVIVAQFSIVTSMAIGLLKSAFDSVDPFYEKMARILGCTRSQAFFKVTLPMVQNGLISSIVIVWARCIGEFGATIMLAGAMPGLTETIPISIFLSFASADVDRALIFTGVLLMVSVASLLTIKYFSRRSYFL